MKLKTILYAVDEGIATITLNRPHRMNAWTGRMHTEYRYVLQQADQDRTVRAIMLTGAGKAFCVGGDSKALEGHVERGAYDPGTPDRLAEPGYGIRKEFDAAFAYHFGLSKPVIALVNGPAAGVGLALACFTDIRFAVPGIKMTTAHGKLNLPAEYGLSWLLPRMIGLTHANDILLSSRIFMSDEALSMGLLNGLHAPEVLVDESMKYVRNMIDYVSPESLKITRRQIYSDMHGDVASAVTESERLLQKMMQEENYRIGVKAMMDKAKPEWEF
ncbi:MAG: enoyl-CoA hydratase/isomerase family protein [Halioglobus sp.]|nr:enoyl-CoA hydratase/isomerase family protein [Halioglobus sp.]